MAFLDPELFTGDNVYPYSCQGDCVVGDEIRFAKANFSGSHWKPKCIGFSTVFGKIIKDSYGQKTQQHTFTIELLSGETIRIKGRNLYKHYVYRKPWKDEALRILAQQEKHNRGDKARSKRSKRLDNLTYPQFLVSF